MTKPDRVFEVSWEVCNKVGGINTVIKSKAKLMVDHYPKGFTMLGPYFKDKAEVELQEEAVPAEFKAAFEALAAEGIKLYYGKWMIRGEPETILIDFSAYKNQTNELKAHYWENYKVDSIKTGWEFEEPMLFATVVGKLIGLYKEHNTKKQVVAHCHEWMAGFALLYLKSHKYAVGTVFTTHATMLGRSIAGHGEALYANLENINPEETAYRLGVQDKFTAEKACAHTCDVFTTVSEITGMEAEQLLGRKPEVLLYNGMSLGKFPTVEETSIKHAMSREKLREFIAYYFFPYYSFEIDHSLVYFITARYEHRNKGLDIMIEALKRLNEYLMKKKTRRTIVVFFWIPLGTGGVKKGIIENKNMYYHIKNYVDWHAQSILKQLTFDFLIQGSQEQKKKTARGVNKIFDGDFMRELKKDLQHFRRWGNPPIVTHDLINKEQNPLHEGLYAAGLDNKEANRVKVIMYPAYLDGSDGMLNLPYYEAIVGAHLGVFPSYYEPWGYTPLESAALAVPAITTDLAGFGRFVKQNQHKRETGIYVLPRFGKSYEEEVQGLYELMKHYAELDHVERVENRLAAKTLAAMADWKHFARLYFRAHELAITK